MGQTQRRNEAELDPLNFFRDCYIKSDNFARTGLIKTFTDDSKISPIR
jgi:hypothetical protein